MKMNVTQEDMNQTKVKEKIAETNHDSRLKNSCPNCGRAFGLKVALDFHKKSCP